MEPLDLPEQHIEDPRFCHHRGKKITRQLQAFSEHKVSTKVEAYSDTILVQKDTQNKISSVSTQQYVARIFEAQILEDINKTNHVEVDRVNNSDLSPD